MTLFIVALIIFLVLLAYWESKCSIDAIKPVTNLQWSIIEMGKVAQIKVFWSPSPSTDIKTQVIRINNDTPEVLELSATEFTFEAEENSVFDVTVEVSDGTSVAASTINIVVPDLTAPQPVVGLGWEIVSVREE
jgi:hypothetical protein